MPTSAWPVVPDAGGHAGFWSLTPLRTCSACALASHWHSTASKLPAWQASKLPAWQAHDTRASACTRAVQAPADAAVAPPDQPGAAPNLRAAGWGRLMTRQAAQPQHLQVPQHQSLKAVTLTLHEATSAELCLQNSC